MKIRIPISLEDVTIGTYQEYQAIVDKNREAEDNGFVLMKMASIFTGASLNVLRALSVDKYDFIVQKVTELLSQPTPFKRIIEVDGIKYGFIPNLETIKLGEYVDLDTYMKDVKNYHRAMAVMYRPITMTVKDTYQIEKYEANKYNDVMKRASVSDTMGAMLFFWSLANELLKATQNSLQVELLTMNTESEANLGSDGVGIKVSFISQVITYLTSIQSQVSPLQNASTNSPTTKKRQTSNNVNLNAK